MKTMPANDIVPELTTQYHTIQKRLTTEYGDMLANLGPPGF